MRWDVIVVGGGPAGCSVAEQIARYGFNVLILEENKKIGEPVQCSGLVSPRTIKLTGYEGLILNEIKGASVHAPSGELIEFVGTRTYALAIDRGAFDRELARRAQEGGADLLVQARVTGFKRSNGGIVVEFDRGGKVFTEETNLLIGADGVNSLVARWAGLHLPVEKIKMFAAEVELENPFSEIVDIFLGHDIAPGWFGWIIPLDKKRARIGTGSHLINRPIKENVRRLLEIYPERFKGMKIVKETGGFVPIGMMKNYTYNVMLVGDAACQTKPISGGGLYLGLKGAGLCSEVAVDALIQENFSQEFLSRYQAQWNQKMCGEIETALRYRQGFFDLSDHEINSLIRFFNKRYWQGIILRNGDIDYPSKLAEKLSMAPLWAEKFIFSCLQKMAHYSGSIKP